MIYWQLMLAFFQVGLFSIGGGYAAMPIIQNQVVQTNNWLTMTEFADVVTISEMTPGPIAINAATFVGTRIAGPLGAVVATVGCVLPACIIVSILAFFYKRYRSLCVVQGALSGLRPAVVGMIASAALSILMLAFFNATAIPFGLDTLNLYAIAIFSFGLLILKKLRCNPILVILGAGLIGLMIY